LNYAGKFDGDISSEGPGSHSHFVHLNPGHVHAPADSIVVPDAHFLFNADFKRSGVDLILSGDDRELVLHDYFKGEKHKALASPDGAHLTGNLVDALTGHVEVAQAGGGPAAASAVIGHVTKLAGSATVIRNGVSIILNMGDNVEKGDVVQSGSNSTVGITFIDGTVFGLSSNAKMVLNEMVYDPNGSNNSSLLSLVAGTITFVAGETAKHGDMKIDTPVATMGIRGTAVLVEIDFSVPGQNGAPNASFQVLVEPDGTTGSYILFDKNTLQPLAIVNQAGQQININNGIISQTQNPLSPEMKALVQDVFQKFFSNTDTNTKTASSVGSSTPDSQNIVVQKNGATATGVVQQADNGTKEKAPPGPGQQGGTGPTHISGTLALQLLPKSVAMSELLLDTNDSQLDPVGGVFQFTDINPGDQPHVTTDFASVTYTNANGSFTISAGQATPTAGLTQLQFADILATAVDLHLFPSPGNANNGKVAWVYEVADKQFDFLAEGETLTLTYHVTVTVNFNGTIEQVEQDLTVVITGTNDQPIITTDQQTQLIHFAAGTGTSGGTLVTADTTGGTFDFKDPDLTDTHWIIDPNGDPKTHIHKAVLTSASLAGPNGTLDKAALEALAPGPMSVFAQALDVDVSTDSTGTGNGKISWQLENLPVFLADFIPAGETLKLYYTIEVTDEHGSTDTKIVEVDIQGTDAAATVWIHTTNDGNDNNWTTGANWGTGKEPTSVNDVIIVTDQLHPNTPAYPATIKTGTHAAAHSVVMNDFVAAPGDNIPPELTLETDSSLTIGADFDLSADSILTNAGTVTVGGKLELLDDATNPVTHVNKSVVTNSGTINLAQGGDIQGLASVTNSGTIELQGGTLNVDVNIANFVGTQGGAIQVDSNAKLILGADSNPGAGTHGGATGGSVTVNAGGELDLTGGNALSAGALINYGTVNVSGSGNKLDTETVTNASAGTIEVQSGDLTIANSPNVTNSGKLTVDSGAKLTVNTSTISGAGTVTDNGDIELTGAAILSGGTLNNNKTLNVSGTGNKLDTETVNNNATIDVAAAALLTLDNGTSITNGASTNSVTVEGTMTLNDTSSITNGKLVNLGIVNIENSTGAKLDNVNVSGGGTINVDFSLSPPATLILSDGTTITGGKIEVGSVGTLEVSTGGATLTGVTIDITSGGNVQVDGSDTLTLDGTINHGKVTDNGKLAVGSGKSLKLNGVAVSNGKISNDGTIEIFATGSIEDDVLTNTAAGVLLVDGGQTVTLDGTTINNGKVTNHGTVNVGSGTLTLNNVTVAGGNITNTGTIDSIGGVNIDDADITNSGAGIIESTAGLLTIDGTVASGPSQTFTLTNSSTVAADGGLLYIIDEQVTNTATLEAIHGGTLKLSGLTVTNKDATHNGTVTIDGTSELDLVSANISGGLLSNSGHLYNVSGLNTVSAAVTNTGTIEVQSGTLDLSGGLTGVGTLKIDTGTTLEIAGADAQTVTFTGGAGTLQLDNTSIPFTGTITGASSASGNFTVTGAANITTASGDALDFNSSGGTSVSPATVTVSTSGTLTGKAGGIAVIQNGTGDIAVSPTGDVTGQAGHGILAEDSATGSGNITVTTTGKVTGTGANSDGILATNLNAANGGNINVTATGGAAGGQ
jgi:hypothetical protein